MASSTDELSRKLSAVSTTSSAVSDEKDSTNNSEDEEDTSDDDVTNDDTASERGHLSRDSTSLSQTSTVLKSRESTMTESRKSDRGHSREPTDLSIVPSIKSRASSREPTDLSLDGTGSTTQQSDHEDDTEEALSRNNTNLSDASLSRENTGVSRPSAPLSKQSSRENESKDDNNNNSDISGNDNDESPSDSYYEDDFHESEAPSGATTREHSFVDNDVSGDPGSSALQKEDSVLIEKDGKFELVDEKDLTAEQRNALGMKPRKQRKPSQLKLPNGGRVRKTSNPEFDHVQSSYAMSEQQKEMKTRRVSVMQMRKQEEKERLRQEQEQKQKAAEKSFNKWLTEKSKDPKEEIKVKKKQQPENEQESEEDEERRKAADKAFRQWLDEKEERVKEEKKMEKIRLTEEAQSYVVRDRKTCDKAFREWMRKKKVEREKQEAATRTQRKKTHTPSKKKSLAVYDVSEEKKRRPKSSVARDEEKVDVSEKKRRPKTSTVRITDAFGYRHPASIDDFITRK